MNDRFQSEIEELIKQDKRQPVSTALANKQRKLEENSEFNSVWYQNFSVMIIQYKGHEKHGQFQFWMVAGGLKNHFNIVYLGECHTLDSFKMI